MKDLLTVRKEDLHLHIDIDGAVMEEKTIDGARVTRHRSANGESTVIMVDGNSDDVVLIK